MLVMELFDYGFLGEGALHFVHHAWNHCLKPDAVVVPGGGAVFAMPVQLGHFKRPRKSESACMHLRPEISKQT